MAILQHDVIAHSLAITKFDSSLARSQILGIFTGNFVESTFLTQIFRFIMTTASVSILVSKILLFNTPSEVYVTDIFPISEQVSGDRENESGNQDMGTR